MGFQIEINSILRSDEPYPLARGSVHDFRKEGSRVFFDTIPIWLAGGDWTARAEITVVTQTRTPAAVTGKFLVSHVYAEAEQALLTGIFRRLYASGGDPNIYVLISGADYAKALAEGVYAPPGLASDGFIHASPAAQLNRVANKYYAQVSDVRLMIVPLAAIKPEVRWEPATGGLYPHLYGPLNMDAVAHAYPVAPSRTGVFDIQLAELARPS